MVKLICFIINHKMFVEVDKKDLVIGTEYTIVLR
jgi:hypothetical protein